MTARPAADLAQPQPGYTYLNRDGAWLDFEVHDLDLDVHDGTLTLAGLPALDAPLAPDAAASLPSTANTEAGIAVAPDGSVFFTTVSDSTTAIARVDGCDGSVEPVPCIGGAGSVAPQLSDPRGLAVHRRRGALLVVDTGNHRVQVFDLETFQLLDVWGAGAYGAQPAPSTAAGRFDTPVAIAVDDAGSVYVADRGRVQQFTSGGQVVATFWRNLVDEVSLEDPVAIATTRHASEARVYVLDRAAKVVYAVDPDGHLPRHVDARSARGPDGPGRVERRLVRGEQHAHA